MTNFMKTLLLAISCGLCIADVKNSADVPSVGTCNGEDAGSCKASYERGSPDDETTLLQTHVQSRAKTQLNSTRVQTQATTPITESVSVNVLDKAYSISELKGGDIPYGECLPMGETMTAPRTYRADVVKAKVCGTSTKLTIFLMNPCATYWGHQYELGVCNPAVDPRACDEIESGPSWLPWAQSFMITHC